MPVCEIRKVVDQWTPALAKLGNLKSIVNKEMKAGGQGMEELAKSIVPVDTGYLQSTILAEQGDLELILAAYAEYAEYVEFGTYKMAPQPYLRPAFDAFADAILDAIAIAIQNAVEGAAGESPSPEMLME